MKKLLPYKKYFTQACVKKTWVNEVRLKKYQNNTYTKGLPR